MKPGEMSPLSKDELVNLVMAEVLQISKQQVTLDPSRLNLEDSLNPAQADLPPAEKPDHPPHQPRDRKSGPAPSAEVSQPQPVKNIKPAWMTKNRLQNCHKPKHN